ncbi:MAG: response regulator transcription factor [Actinomycetes bacterium]
MATNVLIVDDHELIRAGLRNGLQSTGDIDVVGEAASGAEAIAVATRVRPDVIVLDIQLPDISGLELIPQIQKEVPDAAFLMLTMYPESAYLFRALDCGASAFLGKESSILEIASAIRAIAVNPRSFTSPYLSHSLRERDHELLTQQERRILSLLVEGATIKEISELLFIAQATTKTHINHTYAKMKVKNRAQAVASALRLGLVAP